MLRLAADENFNNDILKGVRQRSPDIDLVSVQEAGLSGSPDPLVLDWAASTGRVLLTHDVHPMTRHAYERIAAGLPMPGVLELPEGVPVSQAIEEILIVAECSLEGEWEGQVRYLPL